LQGLTYFFRSLLGKPFALLMPLTTLEGRRQNLLQVIGTEIILTTRRINFETPSGIGSGSWFSTAWFCSGLDLRQDLLPPGYNLVSFAKGSTL